MAGYPGLGWAQGFPDAVSRADDRFSLKWLGPIFMAVSLIGFGIGAMGLHENSKFDDAVQTTGISIDKKHRLISKGTGEQRSMESCWLPVIEFTEIENGRKHSFTSSSCDFYIRTNPVGTIYDVEYVPGSDPMRAREAGVVQSMLMPVIGFGVGAGFLLVGGVLTIALRKSDFSFGDDFMVEEGSAERTELSRFEREAREQFERMKRDDGLRDEAPGPGHVGSDGPVQHY